MKRAKSLTLRHISKQIANIVQKKHFLLGTYYYFLYFCTINWLEYEKTCFSIFVMHHNGWL